MAMLLKVLYGVFVLAVFLPISLSAVENCRPCGPGEYCSNFFGICLACKDYCPGDTDCPSACIPIKPNFTTIASTTTGPTSTQSDTTSMASAVVVQQSTNANIPSGGDNTLLDNNKGHLVLSFSILSFTVFIVFLGLCLRYRKNMKMPSICRFENSENGTEIELEERPRSNGCNKTPDGYTTVNADDHDITIQPGPSQPDSSRPSRLPGPNAEAAAPADPTRSASGPRNNTSSASTTPGPTSIPTHTPSQSMTTSTSSRASGVVVQSASVHSNKNPLESEIRQGARPSDRRSSLKRTPETHRKITDGSNEGHEVSTGASSFNPPNGTCEDIRWERHSGDGD
ncbi:putative protein TPRXL [Strongylocentrotus purpuratus]|uniref:Uncharacterized protein n=1 Tax=Strongylocentrotus purpuratus TaxID=7668 RepID=A0A7M7NRD5_STRPU|nr:putative protein TPRXL [Strongylocentrotus purpuratus]